MPLPGTIAANKDSALMYMPLLLVEIVFADASTIELSTHPLNDTEGGFQYGGKNYLARVADQQISPASVTESYIGLPPSITLRLADADQFLWTNYEKASGKGFKGALLSLRAVLWEADTANFSSDSLLVFSGRCDQATLDGRSGEIILRAASLVNGLRSFLPVVGIQPRCPWVFPTTKPARVDGALKRDSIHYECGYSPDVLDADGAGGTAAARGNYVSGVTPYTDCLYTFEACVARLGNSAHVEPYSVGNSPPIEKDTTGRLTGRFGGIRFDPPAVWGGRDYESGRGTYGQNSGLEQKYQEWVPMLWGTAWVDCPVMQSMGDPNSTRGEFVMCLGEIDDVRLVKCNDTWLDRATDITGAQAYALENKLIRWDIVNRGDRDGHCNLDSIFDGRGDPYGSIAVGAYVVPKIVASSGNRPNVRALVRGRKIQTPDTSSAADQETWPRAYSESPPFQLLDILTWTGWRLTQIDIGSFRTIDALCTPLVTYTSLTGASSTHARFSASFALTKRRASEDIVTSLLRSFHGIRYIDPVTGLLTLGIKATLAVQQPSAVSGSNDAAAVSSKNYAGTVTNGFVAYAFDESSIAQDSLQSIDAPAPANRISAVLNDQERFYAESRYTRVDTDDINRMGKEVESSLDVLGLQNFDQAQRILATMLAEGLRGNPQGDTRGTMRFQFQTTVRAIHLRLGHIVKFSWQAYGISDQLFRVESIKPAANWETATLVIAWHSDDWYVDSYGQHADTVYSDNRRNRYERPPYPWSAATEGPITGDSIYGATEWSFALQPSYQTAADGTGIARLSIIGKLPVNDYLGGAPLTFLRGTTATTGGSLAGGDVMYLAVCGYDATGRLSAPSEPITAVEIPSGTSTNTATITIQKWPSSSVGHALFAGKDPNRLTWQSGAATTPATLTLTALTESGYGMPDIEFDRLMVQIKRAIHSGVLGAALSAVGTGTLEVLGSGWTVNQFAGYDVTLFAKADNSSLLIANFSIASNTGDTLTVSPNPAALGIVAGDVIVIRSKGTVGSDGGGNYLLDANWVNSGGSGLTVDAEIGNLLRIFAGTGRGYTYRIKSNTATKVYIDGQWIVTPDATSRYTIEEPIFQDALTGGPYNNTDPAAAAVLSPEVTNYLNQTLLVRLLALDGVDTSFQVGRAIPVREIYLFGFPGDFSNLQVQIAYQ